MKNRRTARNRNRYMSSRMRRGGLTYVHSEAPGQTGRSDSCTLTLLSAEWSHRYSYGVDEQVDLELRCPMVLWGRVSTNRLHICVSRSGVTLSQYLVKIQADLELLCPYKSECPIFVWCIIFHKRVASLYLGVHIKTDDIAVISMYQYKIVMQHHVVYLTLHVY